MKLHAAGLLGMIALSTVGCGKVAVGTTTLTSASAKPPMTPDGPLPAAIWEKDEEEEVVTPPVETWGVKPPTAEQLATYGF
jgi:hypothetical protein